MMKLITAVISVVTATLLWPLLPKALEVPSPTQLKLANDELAGANASHEQTVTRLQSIHDNTTDALITIDESGHIEDYNLACERIFGYAAEEAIGQKINMLMGAANAAGHDAHLQRYINSSSTKPDRIGLKVDGRRKDGSSIPLEIVVSEIWIGDRRVFSGILRDVTEREMAESKREELIEKLQTFNQELERSNRELDDFAHIASHDLREPLRAVYSHANILLEEYEDRLDEDGEKRLHRMIALSRRLDKLIADLLYFSRLGRGELAVEPLDLKLLIDEIENSHAEALTARNASLDIADNLPTIDANRTQIVTLFQNLIMNGIKYNDADEKRIEIGFLPSLEQGREIYANVFFVRDNGIGIKDMFKEDVFRIFKRLNKEKLYGEGTGAGLTFVKKIVENHGGTIWLQSEFGQGTTFFFTLQKPACS